MSRTINSRKLRNLELMLFGIGPRILRFFILNLIKDFQPYFARLSILRNGMSILHLHSHDKKDAKKDKGYTQQLPHI